VGWWGGRGTPHPPDREPPPDPYHLCGQYHQYDQHDQHDREPPPDPYDRYVPPGPYDRSTPYRRRYGSVPPPRPAEPRTTTRTAGNNVTRLKIRA
jgi:hypothetical protein